MYTVVPLQTATPLGEGLHSVRGFETSVVHSVVMSIFGTEWRTHKSLMLSGKEAMPIKMRRESAETNWILQLLIL